MITIVAVGKVKEKYIKDGINDYIKRLSKYTKTELIEVDDSPIDSKSLKVESDNILKRINTKSYIITLEIDGEQLNSVELSNIINKNIDKYTNITFIIGGSNGLDDSIKQLSNYKLSFSKLTFPHQLFRLILLEQIYRSFKILNNESYHK
jgi:23S rRNA (pseudouridine1915-N3)-methyltransferase